MPKKGGKRRILGMFGFLGPDIQRKRQGDVRLVVLTYPSKAVFKAALMNLLGIGAAYGVTVAIFQWGWAKQLVGLHETVPIVSFLPMFMFAILFGLSMDYEVFLMSRIREEYVATGDNLHSVSRGIHTTARVITAAAIIMVSVFGSFGLGHDPTVKMMGIGLATAILLDATVIRMVLVPASSTSASPRSQHPGAPAPSPVSAKNSPPPRRPTRGPTSPSSTR